MSAKIIISDVTITELSPKVKNVAIQKYLPNTLFPKRMSFTISPVSNAISNAIRRTIACELLVKGLFTEYESVSKTDPFIIPEMVLKRLRMIPIDQKTPLDAVFELDATNDTLSVRDVKASEIKIVSAGKGAPLKKLPFNETYTLFTLQPGKACRIKDIGVHTAYGFVPGDCMHVVAVNTSSVAQDQKPINLYEPNGGDGIPSRISDPRVWKIEFNTNGTMSPKDIIISACDNIIDRVQSIQDLLYSIENTNDEYILTIDGESDTIGNLFMKTIDDLFTDIRAVTYATTSVGRTVTIRIRCDEDINTIYSTTIKHLVKVFTEIKKYFE